MRLLSLFRARTCADPNSFGIKCDESAPAYLSTIQHQSCRRVHGHHQRHQWHQLPVPHRPRRSINGFGGDDRIFGFGGNDILVGGPGIDLLVGGVGNDLYIWDGADNVVEGPNEGIDTIQSTGGVNLLLTPHVENVTLTGGLEAIVTATTWTTSSPATTPPTCSTGFPATMRWPGRAEMTTSSVAPATIPERRAWCRHHAGRGRQRHLRGRQCGRRGDRTPGAGIDTIQSSVSLNLNAPGKFDVEILILTGCRRHRCRQRPEQRHHRQQRLQPAQRFCWPRYAVRAGRK